MQLGFLSQLQTARMPGHGRSLGQLCSQGRCTAAYTACGNAGWVRCYTCGKH